MPPLASGSREDRWSSMSRSRSVWLTSAVVAALPGLLAAFGQSIAVGPAPVIGYVLAGATTAGLVWLVATCWGSTDVLTILSRSMASILVAIAVVAWMLVTVSQDAPVQVEGGRAVFLGGSSSTTYIPVTIAAVLTLLVAGVGRSDQRTEDRGPSPAGLSPVRAITGASLLALALAVAVYFGPATAYVLPLAFFPVALAWAAVAFIGASPAGHRKRRTSWAIALVLALGWATLLANLSPVTEDVLSLASVSWQAAGLSGTTVGLALLVPLCVGAYFVHHRRNSRFSDESSAEVP